MRVNTKPSNAPTLMWKLPICSAYSSSWLIRSIIRLQQQAAQVGERTGQKSGEPCGGGAIDHAVVVAQRQRQHQPRRKLLAVPQRLGLRFGDTQNRHFRGVDARGECGAANAAERANRKD